MNLSLSTLKKIIAVLCCVACSAQISLAQKWSQAKIVTETSDTLRGEAVLGYSSIKFRQTSSSEISEYDPTSAKAIYIDGDIYVSSEYMGLSIGEKSALDDTFFAKALLLGDIKLYYHENKANRNSPVIFFIKKGDGATFQLIKTIIMERINGTEYRRVNDAYRDQLKNLFNDCPSVAISSSKDYYKERPMLNLVLDYVSCKNYKTSYKKEVVYKKPQWRALVGVNLATFNIDVSSTTVLPPSTYDVYPKNGTSSLPFFGIQLAMPVGKKDRFSFFSELMYSQISVTGGPYTFTPAAGILATSVVTTTLSRNTIRFNNSFGRNLRLGGQLTGNLHLGISFAYAVSGKYEANYVNTDIVGTVTKGTTDLSRNFENFESGFFGGAGLNYKRAGLLIRYEKTLGFGSNNDFKASTGNIYLGLTFKLNKN